MLAITRRIGQDVILDVSPSDVPTRIVVTPVEHRAAGVRIAFEAPLHVGIARRELLEAAGSMEKARERIEGKHAGGG